MKLHACEHFMKGHVLFKEGVSGIQYGLPTSADQQHNQLNSEPFFSMPPVSKGAGAL